MSPSPRVAPPSPDARRFDVLVVGSSNTCRSPAAERLLHARLGGDGTVGFASAGTHATPGAPLDAGVAHLLVAADLPVDGFAARELAPQDVRAADLVLTTSRAERAEVVRAVPAAVRRTFTLRELARVAATLSASALPGEGTADRLDALVAGAQRHRGPTPPDAEADDDVLDAEGLDDRGHQAAWQEVLAAVEGIAHAVRPAPAPGEPDAPPPVVPAPASPGGPPRRARRVGRVVLASVVALLVVVAVGAIVALDRLDARVQRFPDPFAALPTRPAPYVPPDPDAASRPPMTVLVLGSAEDAAASGPAAWADAANLTDVVMLAHVSGDRTRAQVVLLPPDLWVDVPGRGPGTLRSAFGLAGPTGAVEAVESLVDVRLDHVALTHATTFGRVTQTLGGVDVDVPQDLVARGRVLVPAGPHRLSGDLALLWMEGSTDDVERTLRAQAWLEAIVTRLGDPGVRGDPAVWTELLGVLSASVAVDESLDSGAMLGLVTSLRRLGPGDVDVVAAPTTLGTAPDGTPVLVPDAAPFDALMDALRADTLHELLDEQAPAS
ncbi:LCP family glycopolymer transferase [Cellulomonas biazotea]|uniref:Phosphotyrosine protein phosphatase I domain-containing protein n=1 Tax=Cellulomonas biazotea TaxID=1709 RepID=A0A402DVI6_9CELL|nr:LCP family protein [Cellulomonas biazotea]GCE78151.1 hypothetical protein CBZ_32070 [Cellulomonas biazotea]